MGGTVADVSPYTNVGNAAQFAGQCEAYVEQQLLGYTGVYSSAIAGIAASDFVRTGDPNVIPAGVAVVFQAAGSNDGYGHVGVSLGVGRMRSVWSSGAIEEEPIAQFVVDNHTALLGFHNYSRGVPTGTGAAAPTSGATSPAPTWTPAKTAAVVVLGIVGVALANSL